MILSLAAKEELGILKKSLASLENQKQNSKTHGERKKIEQRIESQESRIDGFMLGYKIGREEVECQQKLE